MKRKTNKERVTAIAVALHNAEQKVVGVLLISIMILALLYVYFLGSAVVHVVERREVQQGTATVGSRIANLEIDYFARKSDITAELASAMNFSSIAQKEYVERARYLGRASVE